MKKKHYPYRFKTKAEFIKEYGSSWRDSNPIYWPEDMDYLFGQPYTYGKFVKGTKDIPRRSENRRYGNYWTISFMGHLKENEPQKPSYEPKKFVY